MCVCVFVCGGGQGISRLVKICSRPAVQQTHSNTPDQFIPGIMVLTAIQQSDSRRQLGKRHSYCPQSGCEHACIMPHCISLSNCVSCALYQYSLTSPAAQRCLSEGLRLYVHVPLCSDGTVMKNALDSGRFKWAP